MEHDREGIRRKHNRLIDEKSPYLLQHATNPVDWYPWGDDAFERARKEDKPIFLSIGYSTCHWCHVMERESFEDQEAAVLLNDAFVCIKVDREERPDIDAIYMAVCQMLTGRGGWPLTIFMTPDRKPFFAATYIPKTGRFGRPGLVDLIPQIKTIWQTKRDEIVSSAEKIAARLSQVSSYESGGGLGEQVLRSAYDSLAQQFDARHGGFGNAPKFPTPHNLLFLLRYTRRTGERHALEMVEKALSAMSLGGIHDHVGFGFHRYSTDPMWLVPHFEKMLYDQAMLALTYTEAYQLTRKEAYAGTARETFTYVLRDMRSKDGGFFSAEDADSEGVEGKFYLWTESELEELLGTEEARLMSKVFNTQPDGNFVDEVAGHKSGANILHLQQPLEDIAPGLGLTVQELVARVDTARMKLFKARDARIHPSKDDKLLTDWNGIMIAAMARGAQVLEEPTYADAAIRAMNFILQNMREQDGRLLHRFRDGEAAIRGNLDDYAFIVWALLELYELTFDSTYLRHALSLTDLQITHFWDEGQGGFFFTPDDGEVLLLRQKEIYDGAIPSGNSVSMLNLLRLGRMTGRVGLEEKGSRIASTFASKVKTFPPAFTQLLMGVDFSLGPCHEVVITGQLGADDTSRLARALRTHFIPNKVVLFRPTDEESPEIAELAPFTRLHAAAQGRATAFVCSNYACQLPTTDVEEMLRMLGVKA